MTPFTLIPKQLICIAMAWLFSLISLQVIRSVVLTHFSLFVSALGFFQYWDSELVHRLIFLAAESPRHSFLVGLATPVKGLLNRVWLRKNSSAEDSQHKGILTRPKTFLIRIRERVYYTRGVVARAGEDLNEKIRLKRVPFLVLSLSVN